VAPQPPQSARRWGNVIDLERFPTQEIKTLKLRRPQVAPKGDLAGVNPVTRPEPGLVTRRTPVGSIGSCFSSRIQDWLTDNDYRYVQTERDPDSPGGWACQTARFGVVYNTGCCRQVFEAATGRFRPAERWWRVDDDVLKDPYREGVQWQSEDDARRDLERHAECVRKAVEACEVFIVTPGLSEVWKSRADGATFATAPPRRVYNPDLHAFELIEPEENLQNLERMRRAMREINPSIRIIVALSPVPLTATFRPVHWAVGNAVSKASLRVAVDRFCENHDDVAYFPSYEIITTLTSTPFEDDNLHVRLEHIERIMSTFIRAYGDPDEYNAPPTEDAATDEAPWAWETDQPVIAVRSMRDAYLRETWKRLGYQHAGKPVALVGAGAHTEALHHVVEGLDGPSVACVLDDAPRSDAIGRWPVRRFSDVDPGDFAAFIVSSDSARARLTARTRAWAGDRAPIEALYEGLPAGPYPTEDPPLWAPEPTPSPPDQWRERLDDIPGSLTDEEAAVLFRTAAESAARGPLLEVGSGTGRSTVCLASALQAAQRPSSEKLIAIDPHTRPPSLHPRYEPDPGRAIEADDANPRSLFERRLRRAGVHQRVEIWQGRPREFFNHPALHAPRRPALVFINSHDDRSETEDESLAFASVARPDAVILIHGYGVSDNVTNTVDHAGAQKRWILGDVVSALAILMPRSGTRPRI